MSRRGSGPQGRPERARTPRRPAGVTWVAFLVVLPVLAVSACSSNEPFPGSDIAPTSSPSVSVTTVPTPPVGSRLVEGRGWSMAVPGQWEEKRRTLSDSGEVARWSEPSPSGPSRLAVSVVVDRKPVQPLLDQSYRLEQRLRENDIIPVRSAVRRSDAETPGVLVQWKENSRGDESRREVWQLLVPGPDGAILNVVGYAPVESFAASQVPTVMGTFEVVR